MEKISFDTGVRRYQIGNGVLQLNPTDPNLFARFEQVSKELADVEKEMEQRLQNTPADTSAVALLAEADERMKQLLNRLFGPENDFDQILGGVNLLAVASNGERVVTNLFAALEPVLTEGARQCAQVTGEEALAKARQRRENR